MREDKHTTTPTEHNTMPDIPLIGAASGWGAPEQGAEQGPQALHDGGLCEALVASGIEGAHWGGMVQPTLTSTDVGHHLGKEESFPLLFGVLERLSEATGKAITRKQLPVVLGGDHSVAMGTWSGVVSALGAHRKFGLLWFDAHMDAHTPETAHEGKWGGNYHGMPLAHLLGHGRDELTHLGSHGAKIAPEHVCLVGIRSYEPGEQALLQKLGVRIIYMDEVAAKGADWALREALRIVSKAPAGFGVTIDLDGFDPADAPAVATPEKPGVKAADTLAAWADIGAHKNLKAIEIVEYIPAKDLQKTTSNLVKTLLGHLLAWAAHAERKVS